MRKTRSFQGKKKGKGLFNRIKRYSSAFPQRQPPEIIEEPVSMNLQEIPIILSQTSLPPTNPLGNKLKNPDMSNVMVDNRDLQNISLILKNNNRQVESKHFDNLSKQLPNNANVRLGDLIPIPSANASIQRKSGDDVSDEELLNMVEELEGLNSS